MLNLFSRSFAEMSTTLLSHIELNSVSTEFINLSIIVFYASFRLKICEKEREY